MKTNRIPPGGQHIAMASTRSRCLCVAALLVVGLVGVANGAAVMSVDLGSEWMKVYIQILSNTQFGAHTICLLVNFRWASCRRASPWRLPSTKSRNGKRRPFWRSATATASLARTRKRLDCASPTSRTATSLICLARPSTIRWSSCTSK